MNTTLQYILKKLLALIPILLGITVMAFFLALLGRGDPAAVRLSVDPDYIPTEEEIQEFREERGLNKPVVIQYFNWLGNVMTGDLGNSYINDKSVSAELKRRLPNSVLLAFLSLLVISICGVTGGLILALFKDTFIDFFGRGLLVLIMSIPGFCLAYFLIWLFAQKLQVLPTSGAESISAFILPCIALSAGSSCVIMRLLRSSLLGEMGKHYILTARAKGLRKHQLILHHGLRNSMVPSTTQIANVFGGLLGGSMITEAIFAIPGIGSYALSAISSRDYIAIQGYVLFSGVAFVCICLISDVICSFINPQIRLGD